MTAKCSILIIGLSIVAAQEWDSGKICRSNQHRCYQYFRTPLSFTDAENKCIGLGGHLTSIRDVTENVLVSYIGNIVKLQSELPEYWIGANDLQALGTFNWTDGTKFDYKNFHSTTSEQCGVQRADGYGYWYTVLCDVLRPFICVVPRTDTEPSEVSFDSVQEWDSGKICSSRLSRCYQYSRTPLSFPDSESNCVQLGGHLTSIRNGYEDSLLYFIGNLIYEQSETWFYWIGANNKTGSWEWTDGENFNYTNWGVKPSTPCGSRKYLDSHWHDLNCERLLPFICEVPRTISPTIPPPTTKTIPTTPITSITTTISVKPVSQECEVEWTYFQETRSCYKVFHNAKWNDAEKTCVGFGAHLTSIHSSTENKLINDLASTNIRAISYNELTWIGLHQVGQSWVWTDGSKTDYFHWAPKQPDNPGKELCVQTASDLLFQSWNENWNNFDCNAIMRAYVCKKPSNLN